MKKLIDAVTLLADAEYKRASSEHGSVAGSEHEAYALIKEEAEEASDETVQMWNKIKAFWATVKTDESPNSQKRHLDSIKRHAILGACELIQVAAMADKAMATASQKKGE